MFSGHQIPTNLRHKATQPLSERETNSGVFSIGDKLNTSYKVTRSFNLKGKSTAFSRAKVLHTRDTESLDVC